MPLPHQLATHFRQAYFGGNWTAVHLQKLLVDVDYQTATKKFETLNSITALTYHIHYYVRALIKVLEGGPLDAHDKFSYDHPPINTEQEWQSMLQTIWEEGKHFAKLVEALPQEKLDQNMADPKYGTWLRNLMGVVEHTQYHTGQIAIIKKLSTGAV